MDFNTAWSIMEDLEGKSEYENRRIPATVRIDFCKGTASLYTEIAFTDRKATKDTVKRAWETYCRGRSELLEGISGIEIVVKVTGQGKGEKDRRVIA